MPDVLHDAFASAVFERSLLRGEFTLRSGRSTDRYFDKYRVTCDPLLLAEVGRRLRDVRADIAPDTTRIVAPALGAVPLAAALSLESMIPFAIVRTDAKEYGTTNLIEGVVVAGEHALLVEDVVTSGGAAREAVDAARAEGLVVEHALCVLDRDGGGREALEGDGVQLHALLGVDDLDAAFDAGLGMQVRS